MGIAASRSRLPPKDDGPWDAARVAERQRSFEWSELIDPSRAFRWTGHAYFMYKWGAAAWRARAARFEAEHGGGAARARALTDAAVAACPQNAEVRATCVLFEIEHGDDARARAAFDRALADLADDEEAARQFVLEVRRGGAYLSEVWFGGCLHFCRGWWFRPPRWWEQI